MKNIKAILPHSKLYRVTGLATGIMVSACSTATVPPVTPLGQNPPPAYHGTTDLYVNGQLPAERTGGTFNTVFLNTDRNKTTRLVVEVTRKPGYRSPVHYMTYTVTTCVLKGQATMVLDGQEPITTKAGQCFVMPAGIKGYVANDCKSVLKMLDYNTIPEGQDTMVMLEN